MSNVFHARIIILETLWTILTFLLKYWSNSLFQNKGSLGTVISYKSFKTYAFIGAMGGALIPSTATFAQNVNEAGAAELKALFQDALDKQQQQIGQDTDRPHKLEVEGDVVVEQLDSYYAITLPDLKLVYENGNRTEIGIVAINAVPGSQDGQYKMTFAVPSPIINYDGAGNERVRISIGAQKAAGLWDRAIHGFSKLNISMNDTLISAQTDGSSVIIPDMKIVYDLNQQGDRWTGPMRFVTNNMTIENPQNNLKGKIGSVLMNMSIDQFTTDGLAMLNAETPEEIDDVKVADGLDMRFQIKGIDFAKTTEDGTLESFAMSDLGIGFKVDDVLSNSALVGLDFNFDGLKTNLMEGDADALFPRSSSFRITQKNIPVDSLAEAITNTPADNPQMLGLTMMLKVPALLADAGSFLQIENTHLRNQNYDVSLDTVVRADVTAANAATAEGTLKFAGLDQVIPLLQTAAQNSDSKQTTQQLMQTAMMLNALKAYGTSEPHATLGSSYTFDLEMNAAGAVLINGQNAMGLMMGGPPPQQGEQPVLRQPTQEERIEPSGGQ